MLPSPISRYMEVNRVYWISELEVHRDVMHLHMRPLCPLEPKSFASCDPGVKSLDIDVCWDFPLIPPDFRESAKTSFVGQICAWSCLMSRRLSDPELSWRSNVGTVTGSNQTKHEVRVAYASPTRVGIHKRLISCFDYAKWHFLYLSLGQIFLDHV